FPVFAKVREKARAISCLSNVKQLGLAFTQYSQDYDEKNPSGPNCYWPGGNGWAGTLFPYVKSSKLFFCPDDSGSQTATYTSYAYNSNNTAPTGTSTDSYAISKYVSPAKTVLLFEVEGNSFGSGATADIANENAGASCSSGYSPAGWGAGGGTTAYVVNGAGHWTTPMNLKAATGYLRNASTADHPAFAAATGRHTDGANYLMADDHAKWFRPSAVSAGVSNPTETDCNTTNEVDPNGSGVPLAAGTGCSDSTIAATFSL
ncbi:MAG TPA: DUF1559 domain-containing protein, partial [Candidatus Saccharimonadales bacterium]|nr:DUF1559 domain-containing protein [Candidatus Saccharimonadales bacterium]